jgi:hypothetical protein
VVSLADEKLNAARRHTRRERRRLGRWLVLHGLEVAAWLAFYVAIRALVG